LILQFIHFSIESDPFGLRSAALNCSFFFTIKNIVCFLEYWLGEQRNLQIRKKEKGGALPFKST